jgi:hypothetical protein
MLPKKQEKKEGPEKQKDERNKYIKGNEMRELRVRIAAKRWVTKSRRPDREGNISYAYDFSVPNVKYTWVITAYAMGFFRFSFI